MKIAQIAPLAEGVPPRMYGGTERIVSYLTEELVKLGHEVTLFASGDSITSANLVSCAAKALRLDEAVKDIIPYYMLMLDRVRQYAGEFDILHFHIDHFHSPCLEAWQTRPSQRFMVDKICPITGLYISGSTPSRLFRYLTTNAGHFHTLITPLQSTTVFPKICSVRITQRRKVISRFSAE